MTIVMLRSGAGIIPETDGRERQRIKRPGAMKGEGVAKFPVPNVAEVQKKFK